MEFINYYSVIEGYNNELTAGVSTTTIGLGVLILVLVFCIGISNATAIEKVLSTIALVFVFGISVAFVSHGVPWINRNRANEVIAKNNLDKSFIENANVLFDIYNKNDSKDDKIKKNNGGTAVIELGKRSEDLEIVTVPYGVYATIILNKYYNNVDIMDNTELYSNGLLKMGINSSNSLDFSGVTLVSLEEINSLYENPYFGYEAVKSVLK